MLTRERAGPSPLLRKTKRASKQKRVFVAMSGGVDSSVAAFLLKKKGYQVIGGFIKGYNVDGCAEKDAQDARRVAGFLGIPFYIFDLEKEYKEKVVEYMIDGYKKGITPNPDVMCNKEIKFGLFLEKTLKLGADFIATGHYVRLRQSANNESHTNIRIKINDYSYIRNKISNSLMIAKDLNKDQSYFLWALTQDQLRYCLFPIGDYLKSEVRKIAKKTGLPTAEKKDSQGICFLGEVNLVEFLKQSLPEKRGKILNIGGEQLGWHNGAYFYTIGQRHGFGLAGGKPYYITAKDTKKNVITVAEADNPNLYKKEIELRGVNFVRPLFSKKAMEILARVRYRQPLSPAVLMFNKPTAENCKLIFKSPQKFVAPGQSAVFYSKNGEMLGGGIIV